MPGETPNRVAGLPLGRKEEEEGQERWPCQARRAVFQPS